MAEWKALTETDVSNTLEKLRSMLGKRIGNGQCYAVASWYVNQLTDHPHMGAEVTSNPYSERIDQANGAASDIPINYNWSNYGYTVITDPQYFSTAKSGDIICYKGMSKTSNGQKVFSTGKWGHVAIIYGISQYGYTVLEQLGSLNNGRGSPLKMNNVNESIELHLNAISGIVRPPSDKGGGLDFNTVATRLVGDLRGAFSNFSGNIFGLNIVSTPLGYATMPINTMLEIGRVKFSAKEINVGNIIHHIEELYKKDIEIGEVESQMFSSEFCGYLVFNMFNAFFNFKPELISQEDNILLVSGCVGDSNHVQITIKDYNQETEVTRLLNGFVDSGSKSLTILSDNVDTFMQANNNKYDAMMRNFRENTYLMNRQNEAAKKGVNLASEKALYEADYNVTSAKIAMGQGIIGAGLLAGAAIASGGTSLITSPGAYINGAFDFTNIYRQMGYAEQQLGFTEQQVSINKQNVALSNLARKLSVNQSMRMYLANITDIENMPDTVIQLGDDLSFQNGNDVGGIYCCYDMPLQYYSQIMNNYFIAFGIKLGVYEKDLRDRTKKRTYFNYVQTSNVRIAQLDANQSFENTLMSIFNSGVRIWNYHNFSSDVDFANKFKNLYIPNDDYWEENGEIDMTKSEFINSLTAEDCAVMVSKMTNETCATLLDKARTYLRIDQTPSQWAEEEWQKGIDYGVTDGLNPHDMTTREMAVSLIVRCIEEITYNPDNP